MFNSPKTVIFSLIFVFIGWNSAIAADSSKKKEAAQVAQPAIVVNVTKVTSGTIPKKIEALGGLTAVEKVTISAETAGRVETINFKDGQQVAKGMPIVQLDNQQAEADYQSAVTAYHLASQKYERSKSLVDEAISKQDLAVLKAGVATRQATVQSKLADLNEKQVVAPFSGTLGSFAVQAGDYVNAGDALVTLVNSALLRADYNIAEDVLPELKIGQLVSVTTSAYPNKIFYGTVTFISPTVSQDSRMVAVQAQINNKDGSLAPGMFVHISQQTGEIKDAILVPSAAVSADIKGYFVFQVEGNKAVKAYVTTGMHTGGNIQITKGLKVGDTIVVAGQQKLEDGSIVTIASQNDN
jgi:membrane fusion protein (multidrug efflux system)